MVMLCGVSCLHACWSVWIPGQAWKDRAWQVSWSLCIKVCRYSLCSQPLWVGLSVVHVCSAPWVTQGLREGHPWLGSLLHLHPDRALPCSLEARRRFHSKVMRGPEGRWALQPWAVCSSQQTCVHEGSVTCAPWVCTSVRLSPCQCALPGSVPGCPPPAVRASTPPSLCQHALPRSVPDALPGWAWPPWVCTSTPTGPCQHPPRPVPTPPSGSVLAPPPRPVPACPPMGLCQPSAASIDYPVSLLVQLLCLHPHREVPRQRGGGQSRTSAPPFAAGTRYLPPRPSEVRDWG